MESSRVVWMALSLLGLMLAAAPVGEAQLQYNLGDIPDSSYNWSPQRDPDFYQIWADGLTLYANDSLLFVYDSSIHDVTQLWSVDDLQSCSVAEPGAYFSGGSNLLYLVQEGTYIFTSTGTTSTAISADCQQGMAFSITVQPRDGSTADQTPPGQSAPAPGPPRQFFSNPPGPAPAPGPGSGSTQDGTPNQAFQIEINWEPQTDANFYTNAFKGLTFQAGSVLVFSFAKDKHNVVRVSQADFESCTVPTRPLGVNNIPGNGVPLGPENGVYYFIDGIGDNCAAGNMKLSVQVGGAGSNNGEGKDEEEKEFPVAAVVVPVVVVSIVVLALIGFLYYRRQDGSKSRGRYQERHVVTSGGFGRSGQASAAISGILKGNAARFAACTIFTYAELDRATKRFSADNEVGSGGFGTVYKGTLDDGRIVAIKMAKHASDVESFVNEVAILSQVNNRNLVKLLGCCIEVEIPLLVYEFISNGTLQEHISMAHKGFNTRLDWNTRFRIALQTAEALKYLHVQATPPIFHRDVKSANILLDDNFNGKVADFGLSKLVDLEATHVSTVVKGTPGYLDPEYFHNFQLTDKTDVYSFGVVLLELITSKKPIDLSKDAGEQNLAVSSIPLIKTGRVREIMDSHMSSTLSREELHAVDAVAQVAVACLVSSRASRPSMSEVVEMLQRIKGSKLKAEEFYSKADVIDSENRILEMQAYDMLLGESGSSSTTRATSSSGSGSATELMRPR